MRKENDIKRKKKKQEEDEDINNNGENLTQKIRAQVTEQVSECLVIKPLSHNNLMRCFGSTVGKCVVACTHNI